MRPARSAQSDPVRTVVEMAAGCAGCGCVRRVVRMTAGCAGWSSVRVWSVHASLERATDASRPTGPCSRRALRDEIAAIVECDLVPSVIPIQTARG